MGYLSLGGFREGMCAEDYEKYSTMCRQLEKVIACRLWFFL